MEYIRERGILSLKNGVSLMKLERAEINKRTGGIVMNKAVISRHRKRAQNIQMFLMLMPMLILFFLFCVYPLIESVYLSFMKYNGFTEPIFIGLDNDDGEPA